ncbi:hypothetical protein GCM10020219_054520 [Nonomuraea dietziae]
MRKTGPLCYDPDVGSFFIFYNSHAVPVCYGLFQIAAEWYNLTKRWGKSPNFDNIRGASKLSIIKQFVQMLRDPSY